MPVWDEQVARIVWKGQSCLKPLRQKPDKNPWCQSPSVKEFNAIHSKLFALCALCPWFVTCVVPGKPGPVSIPKLKLGDCPGKLRPLKAQKFSNNGSLSPGKYRITWAPKPPKATYVTPYPQKNKYSFLGILSLCLLALFGLLGFFRARTQCHVPRKHFATTHPCPGKRWKYVREGRVNKH